MGRTRNTNTRAASDEVIETTGQERPEVLSVAPAEPADRNLNDVENGSPLGNPEIQVNVPEEALDTAREVAFNPGKTTTASVHSDAGVVRTYTVEEHGDAFADLAKEFADNHGYLVKVQ